MRQTRASKKRVLGKAQVQGDTDPTPLSDNEPIRATHGSSMVPVPADVLPTLLRESRRSLGSEITDQLSLHTMSEAATLQELTVNYYEMAEPFSSHCGASAEVHLVTGPTAAPVVCPVGPEDHTGSVSESVLPAITFGEVYTVPEASTLWPVALAGASDSSGEESGESQTSAACTGAEHRVRLADSWFQRFSQVQPCSTGALVHFLPDETSGSQQVSLQQLELLDPGELGKDVMALVPVSGGAESYETESRDNAQTPVHAQAFHGALRGYDSTQVGTNNMPNPTPEEIVDIIKRNQMQAYGLDITHGAQEPSENRGLPGAEPPTAKPLPLGPPISGLGQ